MTPLRSVSVLFLLLVYLVSAAGCISHTPQETQKAGLSQTPVPAPVTVRTIDPAIPAKAIRKFPETGNKPPSVARGDRYYISGTVNDSEESSVIIWMFGRNFSSGAVEWINKDGSFRHEIRQEFTSDLEPGLYSMVLQFPGENDRFDIQPDFVKLSEKNTCCTGFTQNESGQGRPDIFFEYQGDSCLTGIPAAAALIDSLDDPAIDDNYAINRIAVEDPWIRVNPIGERHAGDAFTITGTTNLAMDDEVLVLIYPDWYTPDKCGRILPPEVQRSGYVSSTIKINKGTGGTQNWSFDVAGLGPEEFRLEVSAIIQEAYNKTLFRVEKNGSVGAADTIPDMAQSIGTNQSGCRETSGTA